MRQRGDPCNACLSRRRPAMNMDAPKSTCSRPRAIASACEHRRVASRAHPVVKARRGAQQAWRIVTACPKCLQLMLSTWRKQARGQVSYAPVLARSCTAVAPPIRRNPKRTWADSVCTALLYPWVQQLGPASSVSTDIQRARLACGTSLRAPPKDSALAGHKLVCACRAPEVV